MNDVEIDYFFISPSLPEKNGRLNTSKYLT